MGYEDALFDDLIAASAGAPSNWSAKRNPGIGSQVSTASPVIDDLSREPPVVMIGSPWRLLTDQVIGGVSDWTIVRAAIARRAAIRMRGGVSLDNNGGFVQLALDLSPDGGIADASGRLIHT